MKDQIRKYILERILEDPDHELSYDEPIIEHSIVDSTEILKLVLFVETKYGITVDDSEITIENFGSIDAICAYVLSKQENA